MWGEVARDQKMKLPCGWYVHPSFFLQFQAQYIIEMGYL
jgi:hypothetical protein